MNLKKTFLFISALILMISCSNESLYVINEDYEIDIQEASGFHTDFTNRYEEKNLMINAERINPKELFAVLMKTDTSNIKVESEDFKNEYYKVIIEQKNNEESVRQEIIQDILNNWNLKLTTKAQPTFRLQIQDTVKYFQHKSDSGKNKTSEVIKNTDSIKIENTNLSIIAELMNSEFSNKVVADTISERIDFSFKRRSFEDLKAKMEKDLGIRFTKVDSPKTLYIIESK